MLRKCDVVARWEQYTSDKLLIHRNSSGSAGGLPPKKCPTGNGIKFKNSYGLHQTKINHAPTKGSPLSFHSYGVSYRVIAKAPMLERQRSHPKKSQRCCAAG